jgi:capsular exopolysaccharide synthesis family protein
MTGELGSGATSDLRGFLGVLRRQKLTALLPLIIVPVVALVMAGRQEKLYEAEAQVLISRQNLALALAGTPDLSGQQADFARVLETQAELAASPEVAAATLRAVPGTRLTPSELLSRSRVDVRPNADLLVFAVKAPEPGLAKALARGFAAQYVEYRHALDNKALHIADAQLRTRLKSVSPNSRLYESLSATAQELRTAAALQGGNALVAKSSADAAQVQPRPLRNLVLGLALGIVLAISFAYLREALDTRLRSVEQVEARLGLTPLAAFPAPPRRGGRAQLWAEKDPHSPIVEATRMLRTSLELVRKGDHPKVVMVTSAMAGEGKSTTAANLAVVLAQAGRRVCLVDLDLRRPTLHQFFDMQAEPGVSDVLTGSARAETAIRQWSAEHGSTVDLLLCGTRTGRPAELMEGPELGLLLESLREAYDWILLDTAPILGASETLALTSFVDSVIPVVRLNMMTQRSLRGLAQTLARSPAEPLGFVASDVRFEGAYGYYRYQPYVSDDVPIS